MQVYAEPQERAAPLPGFREESVASPALLGAAGDSQIALGGGLAAAGTGLDAVALHVQTKANLQKVQDASAAYSESVQKWQEEAQKSRTNAAAAGLTGDFSDFHKQTIEDISKTLDNDAQRIAFNNVARKTGLAARHDVATFETVQTRNANSSADQAMVATNTNAGATAITDTAVDTYRSNIIKATQAYDATIGVDPEVTKARIQDRLTAFSEQRIQNLARTNGTAAKAYFEKAVAAGDIAGAKQAEIGKFVDQANAEQKATDAGGDIWTNIGPEKGLDVMEDAARTRFKDDPIVMKATIANLRDRTAAYDKGQQERTDGVAASVNNAVMNGTPPSQIRKMPEFISLSTMGGAGAKMASQIIEHAENRAYAATLRATAADSRAYTAELRKQQTLSRTHNADYWQYSDPDVVVNMSRDQIINLAPTIGDEHTQNLLKQKDAYSKSADALAAAKLDKSTFNTLAIQAGLDPNAKGLSEDQKDRLTQLSEAVDMRLNFAAQQKGRPLTLQEKKVEAQQAFDDKVMTPGFFSTNILGASNTYYGTTANNGTPVSALKADELKRAFVDVPDGNHGTERVPLNSIPPAFAQEAQTKLRAAGKPITQSAIAHTWVLNRSKWNAQQKDAGM